MASPIGTVYVSLAADTAEFERGIKSAQNTIKGFGRDTATASGEASGRIKSLASAVRELTAAESRMGGGSSANRAQEVAAYGAQLDALRAKFNPVFAASKAYEASLDELNMAHRVGAISAQEYDAALVGLNQRYALVASGSQAAGTAMMQIGGSAGEVQSRIRNLQFQLVDIGQALATAPQMGIYALQNLGFQVAQIGQAYVGQGGFNQAIRDSAAQLAVFARYVGPAAIGVAGVAAAIAGMTSEINASSDVAVNFGDVALASFQVVRDGINDTLMPVIEAIAPGFATAWDAVSSGAVAAGNALVNAMRIAGEGIATAVRMISPAFATAWEGAKAAVFAALADMAGAVDRFVYGAVQALNSAFGTEFAVPAGAAAAYASLNEMANDALVSSQNAAGGSADAWEGFRAKAAEIAASDPLGAFFGAVGPQAQRNALARVEDEKGKKRGRAGKSPAEKEEENYKKLIASSQNYIAAKDAETSAIGLSEAAAARLTHQQDLLNKAQSQGINLTPEYREEITGLAGAMADADARFQRTSFLHDAEEEARRFIEVKKLEQQTMGMTAEAANRLRYEYEFLADAQREGIDLTPQQVERLKGLASTMASVEAETFDFGAAIVDVSDRFSRAIQQADSFSDALRNIGIELANLAVQGLAGQGPLASVLGNVLPSLFGAVGGAIGGGVGVPASSAFASSLSTASGSLSFRPFAKGGVVRRPTVFPMASGMGLMGEAGPEAILPLRRGPGGHLGVASSGGGDVNVNIVNNLGVEAQATTRQTGNGSIEVMLDRANAQLLGRRGSQTSQALEARPRLTGR